MEVIASTRWVSGRYPLTLSIPSVAPVGLGCPCVAGVTNKFLGTVNLQKGAQAKGVKAICMRASLMI